jgi:flagellar hook assembly protein FlgD
LDEDAETDLDCSLNSEPAVVTRRLVRAAVPAGTHTAQWDGADDAGNPVPSGVYVGRLTTARSTQIRKMILLR